MSTPPSPPRLAEWLLERLIGPDHDTVVGDLAEEYADHAIHSGPHRATLIYWGEVLRTTPRLVLYNLARQPVMVTNYFTVALRRLRKHSGFSAINILGLAVSMSVCLLVIALVRDQARSDRFHANADRIYRVITEKTTPYGRYTLATSPAPLTPALRRSAPDVIDAVRMIKRGGHASYDSQTRQVSSLYVEPSFFDVFDFDLSHGDERTALNAPFSLILTSETAKAFFGDEDPIGAVVHGESVGDFTVTGVMAPSEQRTHLAFEALASFSTLTAFPDSHHLDDWDHTTSHYNYLVLAEGASPAALTMRCNTLIARHHTGEDAPPVLDLQALTAINLGPELSNPIGPMMPAASAYALGLFALALMLVAIFNYVSLTVARSLQRAREIGLRKVIGAHRGQIVRQFLTEAVVVSVVAVLLAMVLLAVLLPGFNGLRGFQDDLDVGTLSMDWARDGGTYLIFLLFAVGVGLVAGLAPAYKMASYTPIRVLRGLAAVRGFSALGLRRLLIVGQFTLAIVAIITTLVVYKQVSLVMAADYGIRAEQLMTIPLQDASYEALRNEWMRLPDVVQVAATSSPPVVGPKDWVYAQTDGMDTPVRIQSYSIDAPFLDQFELDVLAGRGVDEAAAHGGDPVSIWLTKKALTALGWTDPEEAVGQFLSFDHRPAPNTAVVAGVVSDFYSQRFERGYAPVVLQRVPERYHYAIVRLRPDDVQQTLTDVKHAWTAVVPTKAFSYAFYDDQLAQSHLFMQDVVKFLGVLAAFVVFIACLGLLGMASYTAETRTKEIGIRKALGATARSVVALLSRDYVRLLLIAVVLGTPLAYVLNRSLLQGFAHRIDLTGWVFVAGILPVALLAVLTLGSQTLKAGYTDPADILQRE